MSSLLFSCRCIPFLMKLTNRGNRVPILEFVCKSSSMTCVFTKPRLDICFKSQKQYGFYLEAFFRISQDKVHNAGIILEQCWSQTTLLREVDRLRLFRV